MKRQSQKDKELIDNARGFFVETVKSVLLPGAERDGKAKRAASKEENSQWM